MKYTKEYDNDDGSKDIWYYDTEKQLAGPYNVEVGYPRATKVKNVLDDSLPITKRKYLNTKNGKYVSYQRAKQLGIIK